MPRRYFRLPWKGTFARRSKLAKLRRRALRRRIARPPKTGGFVITRKLSMINIQSGAGGVAGNPFLNDPTGSCLTLGTASSSTMSNAYDIPFSMKFRLDQLMNSNELTALADRYRIISVLVKVHYNNAAQPIATTSTGSAGVLPWIEYIQDHDDASVPTLALLREKMGSKSKYFSASKPTIKMGVRPLPAATVFNNGITSAYSVPKRSPYINTAYPSVEHYGIKGVLHSCWLPTSVVGMFEFDVSVKLALKDIQ